MSKKAKKLRAAERAAQEQAKAVKAVPIPPAPEPKPLSRKALLILAKREKIGRKGERRVFTRERAEVPPETANVSTAWAERDGEQPQSATRTLVGRLMTGQIAPRYKSSLGGPPGSNGLTM